jgi:hypothetical protein
VRWQVRLVVAVHFRVGVLKQQLGNLAGARDARHAIDVSKLLLGRFSLGQQMLRIVREDGTLIPVGEQLNMRSLSDNVNMTGNLNASGSNYASATPAAPQHAASIIYSSNSSGLSSLMPRLRVPEPDLTDPTESLRELSHLSDDHWSARDKFGMQQPTLKVLNGTNDMWRGEFAPGLGRLQLPDVDIELTQAKSFGCGTFNVVNYAAGANGPGSYKDPYASLAPQEGGDKYRANTEVFAQKLARSALTGILLEPAWMPQSSYDSVERLPGSYANSPNVRNVVRQLKNTDRFDQCAANSAVVWMSGDALTRDGGSSCAAVASVRIADPDVVLGVTTDLINGPHSRQPEPLWSEHQASPLVDMLHQYLKQQREVIVTSTVYFKLFIFATVFMCTFTERVRSERLATLGPDNVIITQ